MRLADAEARELLERFRRWLRDQRLPVTRQRDLIADTLFRSAEHLSAEGVERRLREAGHPVGTATMYRTLETLVAAGLARVHDFGEGTRRYEADAGRAEHGHLVCRQCGAVTEFEHERLERMLGFLADEHGFQLRRARVELHGLCRDCQRRDVAPLRARG